MSEVRRLLFRTKRGLFGVSLLGLFAFLAVFGALLAPEDPLASSTDVLDARRRPRTRSARPRRAPTCSRS